MTVGRFDADGPIRSLVGEHRRVRGFYDAPAVVRAMWPNWGGRALSPGGGLQGGADR